jgi:CelD/BcsL family acetyltransferase involved in cellulose biosynthesis
MVYNQNWSRYSPGWLLIFDTIGFAIERKLQCVDLMMGESAWKDRMCDRTRTVYRCRADLLPWQRGWMNPKTR